ncbi:MBL fold metallo-hydrolase [Aeromicrobium sp.]|uniref:MBL fold metallo-hydrolase n=1 Tax=Aeromicrobium sp. TaxID=1871063 RepID=UPI003C5CAD01
MEIHRITGDVTVMSDTAEVPGVGFLPVNTFVLHAEQPVVVDTGLSTPDKDFVAELSRVMDPADVRWIWLTHPDRDHTGGLWKLLEAAPQARLITTFLGVGIMSTEWTVPLDRVYLLNPGQSLDVGDRVLTGYRPPLYDSPATVGFLDGASGSFFSSDCFGAPMPSAEIATGPDARAVDDEGRRSAQLLWAAIDSPWVHGVDRAAFDPTVQQIRNLDPSAILSTHLPPAVGMNRQLIDALAEAPDGPAFVGPDQVALEQLLASFEPGPV